MDAEAAVSAARAIAVIVAGRRRISVAVAVRSTASAKVTPSPLPLSPGRGCPVRERTTTAAITMSAIPRARRIASSPEDEDFIDVILGHPYWVEGHQALLDNYFDWLRAHIHGKGSLFSTADLVQQATGAPLGTAAFERHLRQRYLA